MAVLMKWWQQAGPFALGSAFWALVIIIGATIERCHGDEFGGWSGRWEQVVATAYTPSDPLDDAYHATKGERWRWICADGTTDVRRKPYGVAVPLRRGEPAWAFGTRLIIPTGLGYLDRLRPGNDGVGTDREFTVDDVGNGSQYFPSEDGLLHIDLRWVDRRDALRWAGPEGKRRLWVFICQQRVPDTIVRIPDTIVLKPETIQGIRETNVLIPEPIWPTADLEPVARMEAPVPDTEAAMPMTDLILLAVVALGLRKRFRRRASWEPGR
jgi:hypothetical protein